MIDNKCFICGQELDAKHNSREHILLDALGDTQPIEGFICHSCNNALGTIIDQPFVKPLRPICESLSSKKTVMKMKFTGDGREYYVSMKDGKIVETDPYTAVKPVVKDDGKAFEYVFLDREEAFKILKKKKMRVEKQGHHVTSNFHLETIDPGDTGDKFRYSPVIDKTFFVLESLKMQTEYFHAHHLPSNDLLGDTILRAIVQKWNEFSGKKQKRKNMKDYIDHLSPMFNAWFEMFEMSSLMTTHLSKYKPVRGISEFHILEEPGTNKQFAVIYLFGMLTSFMPVMTISNLYNIFGINAVNIFPRENNIQ